MYFLQKRGKIKGFLPYSKYKQRKNLRQFPGWTGYPLELDTAIISLLACLVDMYDALVSFPCNRDKWVRSPVAAVIC